MTERIAIVIPTLHRAAKLDPLVTNIINTTPAMQFSINFVVDKDDRETQSVIPTIDWPIGMIVAAERGYVHAANLGVYATDEPLIALVNDDCLFYPHWYEAAIAHMTDGICVVGPSDLSPATEGRDNATQPIFRRSYINERGGNYNEVGRVYHEGYKHNFCDTELWQLAFHRGVAVFADDCVIEHRHPDWGTAPMDATYEQGAKQNWHHDAELFQQRKNEWIQTGAGHGNDN